MPADIKRASWLELFYDLVFVAIIAQLTYSIANHHTTLLDFIHIIFVLYAIFYAWVGVTVNRNLNDSEGHFDRILIQIQMVFAFFMSLSLPEVFEGNLGGFALSYALIRFVQLYMTLRGYRLDPENAPKTKNIVQGMTIATLLMISIIFIPSPYIYVIALMWGLLEWFNPVAKGRGNKIRYLNVYHLQERLGLFLLLVIGESVLVVGIANTIENIGAANPAIIFSSLIMMIAFWWTYFGHLEKCGEGVRPRNLMVYMQAHVSLILGIILIAAAFKNMLKHVELITADLLLLVTGVFLFALMSYVIRGELDMNKKKRTGIMKFLIVSAPITGYLVYLSKSVTVTVIVMSGMVALWAFLDEKRRYGYKFTKSSNK